MTGARAWVLAVLTAANFVGYASRNALFLAYDDLRVRFAIDNSTIGALGTAFMLSQAVVTVPAGWAGDRYDRRRVLAAGLLLAAAAGVAGPLGGTFEALLVSRALVGLGLAVVVPVANSILGELFDGDVKASRIAIFNLGLFVGGAVGLAGGDFAGYPWILYGCALPGFVLALALARLPIAPHRRSVGGEPPVRGGSALVAMLSQAREVLARRAFRWVMASATAMAFSAGGFAAWFAELLRTDKRLSEAETTQVMVVSLVAGLVGVVTGGKLGDFWRRSRRAGRLWTMVIGMSATVPCVSAAILLPAGPALVAVSMVTMFFVSWYHAPMAATVDDLARDGAAATAQAMVVFTMHTLGTAPSSWVVGWLSDRIGLAGAMWLPTGMLLVAATFMVAAVPAFTKDAAAERAR